MLRSSNAIWRTFSFLAWMAPSDSSQNGAVRTAVTLPLNSGRSAGAAMASRKARLSSPGSLPPTPMTPMTNGIFGAPNSRRTSRMNAAIYSEYFA